MERNHLVADGPVQPRIDHIALLLSKIDETANDDEQNQPKSRRDSHFVASDRRRPSKRTTSTKFNDRGRFSYLS